MPNAVMNNLYILYHLILIPQQVGLGSRIFTDKNHGGTEKSHDLLSPHN